MAPATMEHSTPNHVISCTLCRALRVKIWNEAESMWEPADAATQYTLFHEPCAYCDNADLECRVQLCNFCRHLRFRHLTPCSPRLFPNLSSPSDRLSGFSGELSIQPRNEWSDDCDLCTFFTHIEKDSIYPGKQRNEEGDERYTTLGTTEPGSLYITTYTENVDYRAHYDTRFGAGVNRPRIRPKIDWQWARGWLHELPEPDVSTHTNVSPHGDLHNMLVIDVLLDCVVQLPPCSRYLALSYVWGSDSKDQFCCLRSNLSTLSQAGALRNICLPRTISDAILACKQLDQKFLWVDRLCIIQDDSAEELSRQLNQMADIYYHATFTLVAATGDGATHGLSGVSYARDAEQIVCEYGSDFELADPTPSLDYIIGGSRWWTRGWTFQEYVASRRLLFFTDYGMYVKDGFGTSQNIVSEGFSDGARMRYDELDFRLVGNYTQRHLGKETDILSAFSGFLRSIYGDRLSYGMPWDDFDNAILWTPDAFDCRCRESTSIDVFPTWSWISSMCPIRLDLGLEPVYSLAYWGLPATGAATASEPLRWSTLEPSYSCPVSHIKETDENHLERYVVAALSWLHGCVRTEVPSWLLVDCASDEYAARLEDRWSRRPSPFWTEAFQDYAQIFNTMDRALLNEAGSLMVHSQMASFILDWRGRNQPRVDHTSRPGRRSVIVRNDKREIIGTCEISEYSAKRLHRLRQTHATFIALSTGSSHDMDQEYPLLYEFIAKHFSDLPVGAFYGCPCFTGSCRDFEHIEECPEHADFHSIEPVRYRYSNWGIVEDDIDADLLRDRKLAYAHHLAKLSYHDVNNNLLHRHEIPPELWVMLIAPREKDGVQSKVYERIAIGRIYLKRWVEASPVFKSLVLV
jgi:hypothetical protein